MLQCIAVLFAFAASRAARPESAWPLLGISLVPLNGLDKHRCTADCSDSASWTSLMLLVFKDMRMAFSFHIGGFKCLHSFTPLSVALPTLSKRWQKKSNLTFVSVTWHHFATKK